MKMTFVSSILALFLSIPCLAWSKDAEESSSVDAMATEIINRAAEFLAAQEQFSVSVEVWEDTTVEGAKLQFSRNVHVQARRPDRVRIDVTTIEPLRSFYYDGKSVTVVDATTGFYGTAKAPQNIDETIAAMEDKLGITFPLDDVLLSKPFGGAADKALTGEYLGLESILGIHCHHLAFHHKAVDWQTWIADGPIPSIRKVVMTFRDEENAPQLTAIFDDWNFTTKFPDYIFNFKPRNDQKEISIMAPDSGESNESK